jgi:hypothetical protein
MILMLARGHYCPKEHHLELAAFSPKIAVGYTKIATIATNRPKSMTKSSPGSSVPTLRCDGTARSRLLGVW